MCRVKTIAGREPAEPPAANRREGAGRKEKDVGVRGKEGPGGALQGVPGLPACGLAMPMPAPGLCTRNGSRKPFRAKHTRGFSPPQRGSTPALSERAVNLESAPRKAEEQTAHSRAAGGRGARPAQQRPHWSLSHPRSPVALGTCLSSSVPRFPCPKQHRCCKAVEIAFVSLRI